MASACQFRLKKTVHPICGKLTKLQGVVADDSCLSINSSVDAADIQRSPHSQSGHCLSRVVLAQQSVGVFVRAALPERPGVTKVDLDLGGQCQALMIEELFATVPGQRPVKVTGQSLRLFDQRRDDAFSILVRDLDQASRSANDAAQALRHRCPGPADQVALPMAWHGANFNRYRSFSDVHGLLYLAEPGSFRTGVLGAADSAFRSKVLKQFLFQHPRRLNEQAAIDHLV
jgi:hypothetical protein